MPKPSKEYRVKWEIDIYAQTPREAARKARKAQVTPDSSAVVFDATGLDGQTTRIDLAENTAFPVPVYYLLVIWNDIEPEIKGPYTTEDERLKIACQIRQEKGKDHGLYALNPGTSRSGMTVDTFADLPEVDF